MNTDRPSAELPELPHLWDSQGANSDVRRRVRAEWSSFRARIGSLRYRQLLQAMAENDGPDMTQLEIMNAARRFGYPGRTNGSRFSELQRSGAIVPTGQRICSVTGCMAQTYEITGCAVDRKKLRDSLSTHLLYLLRRGSAVVRVASHQLTPGPGETVTVFRSDRRLSTKLSNGATALPPSLPLFAAEVERRAPHPAA